MRRTRGQQAAAAAATAAVAQTSNGKGEKAARSKPSTTVATNNAPVIQDALLGIDLGSSGIRACLMPPNAPEKLLMIHNSVYGNDSFTFPANGRVFGPVRPAEIYLSKVDHDGHEVVALKYAFYILAGASDTLTGEYPLIDKLKAEAIRKPKEFRARLRLGLLQMFRYVILKVHDSIAAGRHPWRIGKACITIPSQWDLDFEAQYSAILGEALNWSQDYARDRMMFFYEPEGLAHFLLHTQLYMNDAIAKSQAHEHRPCLVLDFGGHSMNGCLYYINSKRGDTLNFYAMEDAFGVGSGGEQFADRLVKACDEVWLKTSRTPLRPEAKVQIRETIKKYFAYWGPGKTTGEQKFFFCDDNDDSGVIRLSEEAIDECWAGAYKPALDLVENKVEYLKQAYKSGKFENKPLVVAAGGSLLNEALNEAVEAMVKAAGLGPILKVTKQGVSHDAQRNIVGILHSVAKALTVLQFLRQGAGIAMQMRQAQADDWDDRGAPFWYYWVEGKQEIRPQCKIRVQAGDRFRLIMNPFYGQDVKRFGKLPQIFVARAYNFLRKFPIMPRSGLVECFVQWVGEGNEVVMHLEIVLTPEEEEEEEDTDSRIRWRYKLPLFFDCGTRCMMPGKRSTRLEDVVPDLFTDADGDTSMDD